MKIPHHPITALPAWSKLNDVDFLDIHVSDLGSSKGFGLVTSRALNSKEVYDAPTLLIVPKELVLSAEAVEEWAKVDTHFRELLGKAGGKSTRGDIMLFLLMQITVAAKHHGLNVGVSNPWTEYVTMLPSEIPVPTMWSEEEKSMLKGTSLELAVSAKTDSLMHEFEHLREKTTDISWCQKCWWENEELNYQDWFLLDAWYRSRCLEVPSSGECMIPCVDMVNHYSQANSYYERKPDGSLVLLLRPDMIVETGSEVTISYGSLKTEAEMLFSYGFIDEESTVKGLTLSLEPFPDDPLGKAKAVAFSKPTTLRIFEKDGKIKWESPFVHFMCVNEEDGVEFKVLQENDGSRQLKVFWVGSDVTSATDNFEILTSDHPLKDVFRLRAISVLQERIRQQLESFDETKDAGLTISVVSDDRYSSAMQLRSSEAKLLEQALDAIRDEESNLHKSEVILRYLGSMEDEKIPEQVETNEEEDFS
ncbi:related to SET domain protein [Rhynchosporium secalis]|uniref:Related to SET domain protein n=1 Tax=Rhynchosporium secalis TaxID=38038 RepID=A0A1E1M556_RHYSE|nr:related to SET domain protein [Rhynchosporium secalis]